MAHGPELDFASFVNQMKGERVGGGPESTGHDYSYILDRQTRAAFEKVRPVELAVAATVRMFKQVWRGQLLGSAVKVSERQFSRIHSITRHCADTLHIPTPTVYLVSNPSLNAATYGTNEDAFIIVHSALADAYSDEELLTVIGHECGHIHNSHVVYLTALHYLTRMAGVFLWWVVEPAVIALNAWSRRAEITCDRAGMLCSRDLTTSSRALAKLVVGSRKLFEDFNLEAFLEQYEEGKDSLGRHMENFATHPYLPKRILAMRTFAESELYRKAAKLPAGGLSMSEVDDRVRALLQDDA
ncbi:MAG TPA: M48 family metallopeptidase [Polyangiaceae bacterium]|jgi:Zn-dependent protease with chaperone function|nr:M48 family metallopeptidase [Polyangiaceae bacterium]